MRNLYYKVLNFFSRGIRNSYRNNLRVLAYHDIKDEQNFKQQVEYLHQAYSIVSLEDVKEHILHQKVLPKFPVLITFDDGDFSVYQKGLPVLSRFNTPAVLFVITGLINTYKDFWWEKIRINEKKKGTSEHEIKGKINDLKKMNNSRRLEILENYQPIGKRQLTSRELKELSKNRCLVCNHSHTHPMFNKCSTIELKKEMEYSKDFFIKVGVGEYDVFAYPNGNYDDKSEKVLQENGISLAFLFDHKINHSKINPLRISRLRIDSDTKMAEFKVKVSGFHSVILNKSW